MRSGNIQAKQWGPLEFSFYLVSTFTSMEMLVITWITSLPCPLNNCQRPCRKPLASTLGGDERLELTHKVERYSEAVMTLPLKSNWLICRKAMMLTLSMSLLPTCNTKHSHGFTTHQRTASTTQTAFVILYKKWILPCFKHVETWRLSNCKHTASRLHSLHCALSAQGWWQRVKRNSGEAPKAHSVLAEAELHTHNCLMSEQSQYLPSVPRAAHGYVRVSVEISITNMLTSQYSYFKPMKLLMLLQNCLQNTCASKIKLPSE